MRRAIHSYALVALCVGAAMLGAAPAEEAPAPGTTSVVLVTGSSRGIGLALASAYAVAGWHVIATCRDPDHAVDLKTLAASHADVTIETLDVTSKPSIDALVAKYRGRPIDVLINNAGTGGTYDGQLLGHFDEAVFQDVMRINALAPLQVSSAFLENVKASHQKKIIAISSARGSVAKPYLDHRGYFYDMSKSALNMGMRKLQSDVSDTGVVVGIFTPGVVDTDLGREVRNGAAPPLPLITPAESAAHLVVLVNNLSAANQLRFLNYKGEELSW